MRFTVGIVILLSLGTQWCWCSVRALGEVVQVDRAEDRSPDLDARSGSDPRFGESLPVDSDRVFPLAPFSGYICRSERTLWTDSLSRHDLTVAVMSRRDISVVDIPA